MQDVGLQDSAAFGAAVVRLEGLRLTATEERVEAEAALGRAAELVTELTDLAAAHPAGRTTGTAAHTIAGRRLR